MRILLVILPVLSLLLFEFNPVICEWMNSSANVQRKSIQANDEAVDSSNTTADFPAKSGASLNLLQSTFGDIEDIFRNLLFNFNFKKLPELAESIQDLLGKLLTRLENAVDSFNNNHHRNGDILIWDVIKSILSKLRQVRSEFQNLAKNADHQLNWAVIYLNESLVNQTETIDNWTASMKQELRSLNDTRIYKEGCQIVDDFIEQIAMQMQECCNISVKPMRSICRGVQRVITESFRTLADVIDRFQKCLEDKNSYLEFMMPCINLAYNDITGLIERALQLRYAFNMILPTRVVYSKCCIALVLVEMEHSQHQIESYIEGSKI